jgi:NAD-dependent deacetylase
MKKQKLVAITGSGISVESGLKVLTGGKWEHYNVMDLSSLDGWNKHPEAVLSFYNERRKQLENVKPNDAHYILAELEKDFDVTVITQNVDNLHERAGCTKVLHLHGEITKARSSLHPEMIFDVGYRPIEFGEQAPDGSLLRPHIVWFGEKVTMFEAAKSIVEQADILLVIGSSLKIYPASELVKHVNKNASAYLINPEEVVCTGLSVSVIREKATVGMKKIKELLLANLTKQPVNEKTNLYNIVILDQSGSMESIKQEAINGYNETLQTIKSAQKQYADTQRHYVTLVTFNGSATKTVYDSVECMAATELTDKTYIPDCNTPLYDAMGITLTKFRQKLDAKVDNKVLVTIITDGQENASREYTGKQIFHIVSELKALGWVFTYIGADHDVEASANAIGVDNRMIFEKSQIGTNAMFLKQNRSRDRYYKMVEEKQVLAEGAFFDEDENEQTEKS